MGVEAAVRQADLFHDVGDARAVVPAAPNGARGGPDDPFVGDLLAAWGGPPGGGSAHMMSIIYRSGAERKTLQDSNLGHLIQRTHASPGALRNHGSGHGLTGFRVALAVAI